MGDSMEFASREAFRSWLSEHGQSSAGVWLLFGKAGGPKTLKAGEALEEALCFGWIDGQMQRIDEKSYRKYFSQRRERSKWSEKNKALVQVLEERGLMTDLGRAKVEEAKRNGQWYAPNPMAVTEEQIAQGYYAALQQAANLGLDVSQYSRIVFDPQSPVETGADYIARAFAWESAGYYWHITGIGDALSDRPGTENTDTASKLVGGSNWQSRREAYEAIYPVLEDMATTGDTNDVKEK